MRQQLRETTDETQQYKSAPPANVVATETVTQVTEKTPPVETTATTAKRTKAKVAAYTAQDLLVLSILAIALGLVLGSAIPPFVGVWNQPIGTTGETIFTKAAPQIVTGVLAGIAGLVALWQWRKNFDQRERELALKEDELAKRTAEFNAKQEFDKLNADKKELQDQFADIQNRFADKSEIMRANAALRLGQFALLPRPRTATEARENPVLPVNEENYPYYLRAASQLATALHMEKDNAVRRNIVEAIGSLATWDKLPDDNLLRTQLAHKVADANRTAKDDFIRAFAAWSVVNDGWKYYEASRRNMPDKATYTARIEVDSETTVLDPEKSWQELVTQVIQEKAAAFRIPVSLTAFCGTPELTLTCLESLTEEIATGSKETKFAIAQNVHCDRRKSMSEVEQTADAALRLPALETASQTLTAARAALAAVVITLVAPPGIDALPTDPEGIHAFFWKSSSDPNWERKPALNLSGAFLAGADLFGGRLQGAYLRGTECRGRI